MDPRLSQTIIQAVDNRFEQLRRTQPYSAYGLVASVDAVNRVCSVYVSGDPVASVGFHYPIRMTPEVGHRVRVVIDPRGDRYIAEDIEDENPTPGMDAGTSFPGSPALNDRFFRTDLGEEYQWDGSRWLGEIMASHMVSVSNVAVNSNTDYLLMLAETVRIVRWRINTLTLTTNNGSNYWTIRLRKGDRSGSLSTSYGTQSLAANGTTQWQPNVIEEVAVVDHTNSLGIIIDFFKTGSPGNLYLYADVLYRRARST